MYIYTRVIIMDSNVQESMLGILVFSEANLRRVADLSQAAYPSQVVLSYLFVTKQYYSKMCADPVVISGVR